MWRKQSTLEKDNIKKTFEVNTSGSIVFNILFIQTDFAYNHNANKIAIADSEGNIFVYQRHTDTFDKIAEFKAYFILFYIQR